MLTEQYVIRGGGRCPLVSESALKAERSYRPAPGHQGIYLAIDASLVRGVTVAILPAYKMIQAVFHHKKLHETTVRRIVINYAVTNTSFTLLLNAGFGGNT